MTSSSETRCGSAMFHPPGRRGRGSHTGEVVHKDHPKRKRYILPILPISARWPWGRALLGCDQRPHHAPQREAPIEDGQVPAFEGLGLLAEQLDDQHALGAELLLGP